MHALFKPSLSVRLYLLIIPTTIIAISLLGYLDGQVVARMLDSQVRDEAERIASQLADDMSHNAPTDQNSLQAWLGELMEANVAISRIDVYQSDAKNLTRLATTSTTTVQSVLVDEAAAIRAGRLMSIPQFREGERSLKVVAPYSNPNALGCVSVTASLRQSDLVAEVHDRIALFLVPGSIIVLILMLHFLFTRSLTRRIDRLVSAMTMARSGNLEARASVDRQDELGIIARNFNEAMDDIARASQQRDQLLSEVRGFSSQLQVKIEEATAELTATNERLGRANEELMETQRRLTQAERTAVAGQMAATFAHEIGSPLSAIATHLQLLAESDEIAEDVRRRVGIVQEQLNRITGFVEELLTETRAASQVYVPVHLNRLLRELLLFMEQHLNKRLIRVETILDPALPEIEASADQLQQVFMNLLNNASDALPGGGLIRIETGTEAQPDGRRFVVASVTDNGNGIPDEKQIHIFEPFFSTKDLKRGTGLGLSITAKIVRQHKGTIELKSTVGMGTTFTLRFPARASITGPGEAAAKGRLA